MGCLCTEGVWTASRSLCPFFFSLFSSGGDAKILCREGFVCYSFQNAPQTAHTARWTPWSTRTHRRSPAQWPLASCHRAWPCPALAKRTPRHGNLPTPSPCEFGSDEHSSLWAPFNRGLFPAKPLPSCLHLWREIAFPEWEMPLNAQPEKWIFYFLVRFWWSSSCIYCKCKEKRFWPSINKDIWLYSGILLTYPSLRLSALRGGCAEGPPPAPSPCLFLPYCPPV